MRQNLVRTVGLLVFVGLLMPEGMLLAKVTSIQPALNSSNANWYDVEQASNLLHRMQALSLKVRREVARLQVQEIDLTWGAQSVRLARATYDLDTVGRDLAGLDQMKGKLEPWQQNLIHRITPQIHEMIYQMNAALKGLKEHQSRAVLALTQYPQNINSIYKNANQTAGSIGTVTQYARTEEKMAELQQRTGKANS